MQPAALQVQGAKDSAQADKSPQLMRGPLGGLTSIFKVAGMT
jgi:hypothetical protein